MILVLVVSAIECDRALRISALEVASDTVNLLIVVGRGNPAATALHLSIHTVIFRLIRFIPVTLTIVKILVFLRGCPLLQRVELVFYALHP